MLALALFSGGLDSLISMKLLKDQGFRVIALHFDIGFGSNKNKQEYFKNATEQIGVELEILDIKEQFFNDVLFAPRYGYGKHFNPCIDCHANMFRHAFYKLLEYNATCVISGEVLGQRPKSQRREALDIVKKVVREIGEESKFDDILSRDGADSSKPRYLDELLLRPLSAKLMSPSFVEKKGIVDRSKLLDISGRGRHIQLELAKRYGFRYYEKPGGGCLLTESSIATKIKDLRSHRDMHLSDISMIKVGRYLVLPDGARCVIGRDEEENQKLESENKNMDRITLLDSIGGVGLLDKNASKEDKILAGQITLAYGKTTPNTTYKVQIGDEVYDLQCIPKEEAHKYLLIQ